MECIFKTEPREIDSLVELAKAFAVTEGAAAIKKLDNERAHINNAQAEANRKSGIEVFRNLMESAKPFLQVLQAAFARKTGLINKDEQRALFREWLQEDFPEILDIVVEEAKRRRADVSQIAEEEPTGEDTTEDPEDNPEGEEITNPEGEGNEE